MTSYPNSDAGTLSDAHRRMLYDESGIAPEVVEERGVCTTRGGRELPDGFSRRQRKRGGGLLFTVHRPGGKTAYSFRPDATCPENPGHRYEQPCKHLGAPGNVLDVHPSVRDLIDDISTPVIFCEGIKKADSILSAARREGVRVLVVAITGVWNWMADGEAIADMFDIPLEGRKVTVLFDSDMLRNPNVQDAARRFAGHLIGRGAEVFITYLPEKADGSKMGADDFLAAGGTLAELRMLTRRYDPADFVRVRLSRDETLRAMLEDLQHRFWDEEWKGMGGHTDRDVALKLIEAAFRHGKPVEGGIQVRKSWGSLQTEAKVAPRTLSKSLNRLEERGFILERVKGKKPDKSGGFVLRASVYQGRTEQGTEQKATQPLQSLHASTIHLRAPRLRWSSPGYKPRRGTSPDTRRVRQGPPPEARPTVKRLGKIRGAIVDALDAAGGELTLQEIAQVLKRKRPRDIRRRNLPMLEEAGVLTVDGDTVTLADDWPERLEDARRLGGEVEADELALTRLDIKRKGYHGRHRVKADEHYVNAGADGYMEDLERDDVDNVNNSEGGPELSRLAQTVRDYLDKRPNTVRQHGQALAGWLANTFWAYELACGKPTPDDVRAAIDELGGERYLRERLEVSRGAVA
jgi:Domain of unknown function (DUF3854)